jgi:hypothetical protein
MIIHLEAEWDDAILERFALVIGQQSLHFALQLNWILQGAIEDYQPELPDGSSNPNYNFLFYSRCIKLLTNMERCVVYRKPRSQELQRLYEKGKITKQEYQILEHADRRFNAIEVTAAEEDSEGFGGILLYKRTVRTACYKAKPWKKRYFCIEARMFNCYNQKGGKLVRSMPLEGAQIEKQQDAHPKYKFLFKVANRSFEFRIRADTQEDQDKWIKVLKEESTSTAVFGHMDTSLHTLSEAKERVLAELTAAQRARYEFFRDERDFVRRLTDIAEELRFKVPADRKKKAPKMMKHMEIPPCVYVPLCNSTDTWRRVTATLYKDTRVFNTNERCPVIMYFLATRGELPSKGKNGGKNNNANLDVAEYMHQGFEIYDEEAAAAEAKATETETIMEEPAETGSEDASINVEEAGEVVVHEMYGAGGSSPSGDSNPSSVWHDSIVKEPESPGNSNSNKHLNRFLRESFVSIPRKLATRLESRRPSIMDNATGLQSVPILEGDNNKEIVEDETAVGRSSIMKQNSEIILGDLDEGDIDIDSINRAKMIVSHGESWAEKSFRMLEEAKHKPQNVEMEVVSLMSKSNDDLRQEVFVMQMIHYYKSVFVQAKLPLWLKTYRILSSSSSTGLIEVLVDATSIDGLKKADGYPKEGGMRKYFEEMYGGPDSKSFKAAQQNFMHSLAAYSLVMYLLGLKDRHNGNIMIDTRGHLIFIDFGFAMGMAPGHEFSMERAPFKFTKEYLEVMDGPNSACYKEFKRIFVEGFKAARANSQIALGLVEIMMYKSNYPCFSGSRYGNGVSLRLFEKRLMLDVPDQSIEKKALGLIETSLDHWGTNLYDGFQQWSNGYAK